MKKLSLKKALIGVACAASIGVLSLIYIEQQQTIKTQSASIVELQELHREETEKVEVLSIENKELSTNLESARQRSSDLRERVERNRTEIEELEVANGNLPNVEGRKITVKVTGYCPCEYCCGIWASLNPGVTASGTIARYGTIAAPTSLPFGTQLMIEGYGDQVFTVEDTGSAVVYDNGIYVIDMWMPTHEQAYAIGNSIVEAIILE